MPVPSAPPKVPPKPALFNKDQEEEDDGFTTNKKSFKPLAMPMPIPQQVLPPPPAPPKPQVFEESEPVVEQQEQPATLFEENPSPMLQSQHSVEANSEEQHSNRGTATNFEGMRVTENLGPNASVKDIAKNMNFGMMGGMSLTQKKLMEKKQ